jgi:hypothetical protein
MKRNVPARAKVPRQTREFFRQDVRTPHVLAFPGLEITRLAPRLHSRANAGIGFAHAFTGVVWVWSDAIPQRNCGRF